MKFILTRTSLYNSFTNIDVNGEDTKLQSKDVSKKWKVEEEIIDGYNNKSKYRYKVDTIEIATIEQLLEFQEEVGSIIIEKFWPNENYFELEIYDDYRE